VLSDTKSKLYACSRNESHCLHHVTTALHKKPDGSASRTYNVFNGTLNPTQSVSPGQHS